MKTECVEVNDGLAEGDILFSMETDDEKKLLEKIFLSVVGGYINVDFEKVRPYVKADLEIALVENGNGNEYQYMQMSKPTDSDFGAVSVVFSVFELISSAQEIKFSLKGKKKFYLTMLTEKGKITFETCEEKKKINEAFGVYDENDIGIEEHDTGWPAYYMEQGFKVSWI